MVAQNDLVLVVDYGAQYSHFVARLVRDTRVYSEIVPRNTSLAKILDRKPKAVILSDGLCSVREPSSSQLEAGLLAAGVPTFNVAAQRLDGEVCHPALLELGPERQVLEQFLFETAGCRPTWTAALIVEDQIARIRAQVGNARAICGLSGGVDSAVSAALVQKAIGSQLTCVFVDHGLVRQGEREQVERDFVAVTGANLKVVDATEQFLGHLAGVSDPETKRKIIGREFIRVFEAAAREIISETPDGEEVRFLVQGTIYPDVVESGAGDGTGVIKSHHNVGGLPEDLQFSLIEPLRELFKDEVRQVGRELGLPGDMVERHPFPGPGLGIRIVGAIDAERLRILRAADAIVREESKAAGIDREVWQFPVVLLADVRSVGVTGEERTYGHPIVLRPILSTDAMTADWAKLPYEFIELVSNRITSEVPEINRVVLDVTSKPPATIEWE